MLLSLIAVFSPPADNTFGPQLLQMCNQGLFECLALNLYCLRGEQSALTSVINHRIVSTHTHTLNVPYDMIYNLPLNVSPPSLPFFLSLSGR